ncbi:(R,R)-butanediol dehydrogenase / meso-butanediol dehydrogenase / diacetyl reductase/hypothetical protein [Pseudonocardia thermophila]|uniref:Threonine dehydrogenase n=1 Tax=Pseudonocardia thermophila TaxID=1848 RepID=A0A1M6WQA3_PSETH|nr:alcohol dehydrogenase catalytic domain-containing protein [Pseudonocardia thermophila]SHK95814.1 (R,R)-butanediol dehydrogenase / meso-butanediol dehydrogenase / diacetyl reductase/hypothetical protein [Pseudonocardia thermophila]
MQAVVFDGIEQIRVAEVPEPECGPEDVIVDVVLCGICGSDLASYRRGALIGPGQVMGHEFAGTVSTVGARVEGIEIGDRVTVNPLSHCGRCRQCRTGHAQLCLAGLPHVGYGLPGAFAPRVRVPRARLGANVHVLPDGVDFEAGALVEPYAVALHAVKLSAPDPHCSVAVLGMGPIGLAVTQVLRAHGVTNIVGVERSALRGDLACKLGATVVLDGAGARPLAEEIVDAAGPVAAALGGVDHVFETSGVGALLEAGIAAARPGGTVRVVALHAQPVPLDAGALVGKEITLGGSNCYHDEFAEVLELMRQGVLATSPLVSGVVALEDALTGFLAQLDPERGVKYMVRPA